MIGVDVFSGAGGMSLGAADCGIDVHFAIENDPSAARTYAANHINTKVLNRDIRSISAQDLPLHRKKQQVIMFGGPPCQGFSTSNQKTRGLDNEKNWLFKEYLRLAKEISPDWIVFENVRGLIETESGYFLDQVITGFEKLGYSTNQFLLNSVEFGVPQKRNRLFIIASLHGISVSEPTKITTTPITVKQAIQDLPDLDNGDIQNICKYCSVKPSNYSKQLRKNLKECTNNIVTKNAEHIIERYSYIPQGGNWQDIPKHLMETYSDVSRCHTGIYRRLKEDEPSIVIGNYRKNMLIHPWKNRGLSVREAARIQSFPDEFVFYGSIGFQQQQVGNAVPPLLARAVFKAIKEGE